MIKRQGAGMRETFTVRKQSFGVGVERTFPLHSPKIEQASRSPSIGDVNRAKLYYLRGKVGKKARVREKQMTPADRQRLAANNAAATGELTFSEDVEPEPAVTDEVEAVVEETPAAEPEAPAEEPEAEASRARGRRTRPTSRSPTPSRSRPRRRTSARSIPPRRAILPAMRGSSLRYAAVAALVASVVAVGSASSRPAARDAGIPVIVVLREPDRALPRSADALVQSLRQRAMTSQRGIVALLGEAGVPFRRLWITNALVLRADEALIARLGAAAGRRRGRRRPGRHDGAAAGQPRDRRRPGGGVGGREDGAPAVWAKGARGQGIVIGVADTGMQWRPPGAARPLPRHVRHRRLARLQLARRRPRRHRRRRAQPVRVRRVDAVRRQRPRHVRHRDRGGRRGRERDRRRARGALDRLPEHGRRRRLARARKPSACSSSSPDRRGRREPGSRALGRTSSRTRTSARPRRAAPPQRSGRRWRRCARPGSSWRSRPATTARRARRSATRRPSPTRRSPSAGRRSATRSARRAAVGPSRPTGAGARSPTSWRPARRSVPRTRAIPTAPSAAPRPPRRTSPARVALLWSAYRGSVGDVERTKQLLRASATRLTTTEGCGALGDGRPNNTFGAGRVQVAAAYDRARTEGTTFPTVSRPSWQASACSRASRGRARRGRCGSACRRTDASRSSSRAGSEDASWHGAAPSRWRRGAARTRCRSAHA